MTKIHLIDLIPGLLGGFGGWNPPSGNIGRGFHHTKKGPGRRHNNSGLENRFWVVEKGARIAPRHIPRIEFDERNRLNHWTKEAEERISRSRWAKELGGLQ